ncbi:MAG: threonine--tRNA ligase [Sulfuricaulis sp.]
MPIITLPDGSRREYPQPVTVAEIAASIGAGLARAALAGRVNGKLVDTSFCVEQDATVAVVTDKSPEGIEVIRHSTAHLLAQAVKELFPEAQVTIGPVIENGFYYDFAFKRGFTEEDLAKIEQRMHEIARRDYPVTRTVMPRDEAVKFFRAMGEEYKAKIIEDIPAGENISLYRQGEFVDLCRGPHVPSTGKLKVFKLMKVAGAYWRGDSHNEMLARIYGTAWTNKETLETYLQQIEEAEKRDHRKIGRQLDLFHLQEEAPGMVFWHDRGWRIYTTIVDYIRRLLRDHDYQEVHTPQLVDRSLWERSGHWEKFHADMFITESEKRTYAVKPMNCPCHVQIYNQGLKSYRDLPLRMAEFGSCHRNEQSGALHGVMRVRGFVQDDAHIFCTEAQMPQEISAFIDLLHHVYGDFGFRDIIYKLSTRPASRLGSDETWDKAEHALEQALNAKGVAWDLQPGEGSFYGPKIEFSLRDSLGRIWQCGTIQVDYNMPERLGATYIAENGAKQVPVMLHRAILGSLERFIGILIEEHAGALPTWLAPVQAVILTITDEQQEAARNLEKTLRDLGWRVESDLRNEKIGFKIREHTLQRLPYLLVVGKKEAQQGTLAVRTRKGEDLGAMSPEAFSAMLTRETASRGVTILEEQKHRDG